MHELQKENEELTKQLSEQIQELQDDKLKSSDETEVLVKRIEKMKVIGLIYVRFSFWISMIQCGIFAERYTRRAGRT